MVEHYLDTVGVDGSIPSGPTKNDVIRSRIRALAAAAALAFAASGCGGTDVATPPVLSGPAPALDGTWDFDFDRALVVCKGTMTIDGSTGAGTFTACYSQAGTVTASADANQNVVVLFSPVGLDPFWVRGKLLTSTQILGPIYGVSWNGQQEFRALRR